MEPDIGPGVVTNIWDKQIEVRFGNLIRRYSAADAPLKPLRTDLQDPSTEALFHAEFASAAMGQLHLETLYAKWHAQSFEAKGWLGGKVQVIPHQVSTAKAIVDLMPGRFWLADEVGLGKTITAGLALHRLVQSERMDHVLILVPDSLIIQWFIELFRKFNLPFTMFNDYFKDSLNPQEFWDQHKFCLSSYEFVASSLGLQASLLKANWDLLICDEAHHLSHDQIFSSFYLPLINTSKSVFYLSAAVDALPENMLGKSGHIYRSTREQIPLFPQRSPKFMALNSEDYIARLRAEFLADEKLGPEVEKYDFSEDPRLKSLINLIQNSPQEKILLIAHTQAKALAILEAFRKQTHLEVAVFHEGMTLVQRDRMAAYFADNENVPLLICSEIGSEGRNFQFCQHLFMFDYPLSIDLLEQRIGRLDRIGQTSTINIHLPYIEGTPQAGFVNWLKESIGLFDSPSKLGDSFLEQYRERLIAIVQQDDKSALKQLISETIAAKLAKLSERSTFVILPVVENKGLLRSIRRIDNCPKLEAWFDLLLEHYEWELAEIIDEHAREQPYTFSRKEALIHEGHAFLTWDHPIIENAMTLLLTSAKGVCSICRWPDKQLANSKLLLEASYSVECSGELIQGFPMRVLIDEDGKFYRTPLKTLNKVLREGVINDFRELVKNRGPQLKAILEQTKQEAQRILHNKLPNSPSQLKLEMIRLILRG